MSLSTSIKIVLSLALCLLFPFAGHAEIDILHHDLEVTLFPSEKRLLGSDRIDVYPNGAPGLTFHLSPKASVEEVTVNGKRGPFSFRDGRIHVPLGPEERIGRISVGVQYSAVKSYIPGGGTGYSSILMKATGVRV